MTYRLAGLGRGFSRLFQWILTESGINSGTQRGRLFFGRLFCSVSLVSVAKDLHDRITSRLNLWNKDAYGELVQDSYRVVAAYFGKACGTQTQEQRQRTFLNLVHSKLRESVQFICERQTGRVLLPNNQATGRTVFMDKTAVEVLAGKLPPERKPMVLRCKHTRKHLFLLSSI